eukprot:TRINITY_DN42648_c0_g1_i1.p1 TRINITY_DN42648_c0_g1~~TRINITY_DN42648_c0_g1_i1.p1  ORF type:complete len:319 (-),score=44.99 TRINITY_DN42648_c0_g1_i1:793-1749(-)
MMEMQAYMVGLTCMGIDGAGSMVFPLRKGTGALFLGVWASGSAYGRHRRANRSSPLAQATADSSHSQDHYAVLGLPSRASSADIKRAYRLLALKYHPDVSKDLQADEVFKSIRLAYEVLSNEASRAQYDNALHFQDISKPWGRNRSQGHEFDEGLRVYRWEELRQRMWNEKHKQCYDASDENSSYANKDAYEEVLTDERESFAEVLRFAFFTLFFMQTLGTQVSLTLCGLTALLDKQLDAGYKLGYLVAWAMGGRGGILMMLCLSFASWLCGKCSSSFVVLVVIAMWIGANIARLAPIPQGALLTLLYMSMKLQVDLS